MIGCSSLTLSSKNSKHFLARTMDFTIEMAEEVIFVPRNKKFQSNYSNNSPIISDYAFAGVGQLDEYGPLLYDGINEKGLMGATLYFPRYASYKDDLMTGKINISPDRIISTVLSKAKSLTEVANLFKTKINIINQLNPTIKTVPPLHFIFSDQSGQSLIIEPKEDGIDIIENSIGVMTNSPDYHWHETNLRNYITLTPKQHSSITFINKELMPFSQGSGTFGLPGDYTPPSRFVRTAFLKNTVEQAKDETSTISLLHHILESVSIPKGAVINEQGAQDYTCYTAYMCSESLSFYYSTYYNQRINKLSLKPLLNFTDYKIFKIDNNEDINEIN
ncbi:choloylglycine hydrolase family protein [Liquorilactobacillus uvarum]|uniref:Penicillin amidase n=1 Tax=Liquorilactobacillus uvarum DSM 19971 TaxID=1423812 RepID=A0A0R1QE75_9LACO|nr:choloylglycine hydrolase family protein [Liquorilactobacillus uvarum]KRL39112.1 penicillin amidase [Liquorilactobacillus uvarum DSM 19971]